MPQVYPDNDTFTWSNQNDNSWFLRSQVTHESIPKKASLFFLILWWNPKAFFAVKRNIMPLKNIVKQGCDGAMIEPLAWRQMA